jgi:hypothetical protein
LLLDSIRLFVLVLLELLDLLLDHRFLQFLYLHHYPIVELDNHNRNTVYEIQELLHRNSHYRTQDNVLLVGSFVGLVGTEVVVVVHK